MATFPANLAKVARRKLIMVDAATFLEALNSPPGNRLEALKGKIASNDDPTLGATQGFDLVDEWLPVQNRVSLPTLPLVEN